MGRPRRAESPSHPYTIRVSPVERRLIEQTAQANFQTLSEFTRLVALDRAEEVLEAHAAAERRAAKPVASGSAISEVDRSKRA